MGCVYVATNKVNGKQYVGKTTRSLSERIRDHCKGQTGNCRAFHAALKKYGLVRFDWKVLLPGIEDSALNAAERATIALLGTRAPRGYNLTDGGDGFDWSDASFRERRRSAAAAARSTPQFRAKLSAAIKRLYQDPEHVEKMARAVLRRSASSTWRREHRAGIERRALDAGWHKNCAEARKLRNADPGWRQHHAEAMARVFGKSITCVETGAVYVTAREAWRQTGISPSSICQHLRGRSKSAGGLHWRYAG